MKLARVGVAAVFVVTAGITGCTYVQETAEGQSVRVATSAETASCKHLGKVTVSVVKMGRGDRFVREDLVRLARNKAATSNADAVVPAGEPKDSEQTFDMYRCTNP